MSDVQELLAGLTEPQMQAATHVDGPLLVLAGPGSGKTRVITRRIAYLVKAVGIAPWNVLAITFTNKAAGEMRDRVANLLSERQAHATTVATFHSLCARLIRQYAERLGLPPGYSIYDTADQKRAIKQALEDLEINTKNFPPASMLSSISNAKNDLLDAAGYAKQANNFYDRTVAKVYTKYESILTRNAALDFDDLLLKTVTLFKKHPDALAQLREKYQYVMIDEYQDTNHAQFMIANALAPGNCPAEQDPASFSGGNIMCTGDPDQSIYGWRGANIQNILEFEQHYPAAQVVRLEQNYRSTKRILAAADALIGNNRGRRHKDLWTDNPEGELVKVVTCADEKQEASWIADEFQRLHDDERVAWGQMAVFYRINSLSRVIEETLRNAAVPYQIARGTAFYDRKEIKDAIAYLRVVANPSDEVNLLRVINTPARGISATSVKAMQAYALAHTLPIDDLLGDPLRVAALNARAQTAVAKFGKTTHDWRTTAGIINHDPTAPQPSLRSFVEDVLRESGLEAYYRNDKSDPDQERLANLGELVTSAQQFEEEYEFEAEQQTPTSAPGSSAPESAASENLGSPGSHAPLQLREKLLAFLERIALVSDADSVDDSQGMVTLMTLHAAKGLEYPVVAMIGVEDGLLPHDRANGDDKELEEERRLAFVGITRAEQRLYLCHGKYRTVFGQTMPTIRSRFISELPADVLEEVNPSDDPDAYDDDVYGGGGGTQRSLAAKQAGQYPPGTLVKHPQFGLGRVVKVSPMGAHTRARIDFTTSGSKTLILQYARLEVVHAH